MLKQLLGLALLALAIAQTPNCLAFCNDFHTQQPCAQYVSNYWADETACLNWCNLLPLGAAANATEQSIATVGCHQYHLGVAISTGNEQHCFHAGITGGAGGSSVCGTYCDTYCILMNRTCNAEFGGNDAACQAVCAAVPTTGNDTAPTTDTTNSIQCRIYHAGNPALASAAAHCPHASPSGGGVCGTPCEGYCSLVGSACGDAQLANGAIYFGGIADCVSVCDAGSATFLDQSNIGTTFGSQDVDGSTLACRTYHAGVPAFVSAETHCPHASLSGAGVCGTLCEEYCSLFQQACTGSGFEYASTQECLSVCAGFPEVGNYTTTSGNDVYCRIYHAGVSLTAPDPHCSHASAGGGGACGGQPVPSCQSFCNQYQQSSVCTFTNNWGDLNSCLGWCAALPKGFGNETDGITLSCHQYHLDVAEGAGTKDGVHCTHAGVTGAGVCGSFCQNYCTLMSVNCPSMFDSLTTPGTFDMAGCMQVCALIPDTGDNVKPALVNDNSIQCRIYHGAGPSSPLGDAAAHCPHASPAGGAVCGSACDGYCQLVTSTCGANAGLTDGAIFFGAIANCPQICAGAIDPTNIDLDFGAVTGNTLGCRAYHGGLPAIASAETHCPHASPSGGDVCGSLCEEYCYVFNRNCGNTTFAYADNAACLSACSAFPVTGNYTTTAGDDVYCRIYHAAVSSFAPDPHCSHASQNGAGVCGGQATTGASTTGPASTTGTATTAASTTNKATTSGAAALTASIAILLVVVAALF